MPLADMRSYGDLSDCRKIYFGLPGDRASHRIVYQEAADDQTVEILEVVAVEARDEGYVYLQAAKRLGRLPAEAEPKLKRASAADQRSCLSTEEGPSELTPALRW